MARSFSQHLTILADKCGQILRRNSVRNNPAKCVCVPVVLWTIAAFITIVFILTILYMVLLAVV